MPGTLFVVATPLGNLEDLTLRAIRVFREVDAIAAEDTRRSRKLLAHLGIHTPLVSYYDQVERRKAPRLVARLGRGESIALISDAGTPGIADPGYRLVSAAIAAGIPVVPVPGPSAITAVLSVAGLPADRFAFEGFVPVRAAARRAFYESVRREVRTVICFEAARRLRASLADLSRVLRGREVVVAREVTKLFEEFLRGQAADVIERLGNDKGRGEVTILIAGAAVEHEVPGEELRAAVLRLRKEGLGIKEIARLLAGDGRYSSREVYQFALGIVKERKQGVG